MATSRLLSRFICLLAAFMFFAIALGGTAPCADENNGEDRKEPEVIGGTSNPQANSGKEETMAAPADQKAPDAESTGPDQPRYPGVGRVLIKQDEANKPSVYFYYPSLGNEKVDASLKSFAEKWVVEFLKEHRDDDDPGNKDLSATYAISRPNENVISITYNVYSYEGGAHGNSAIICLNYDLRTGQELKFSDIFKDPEKAIAIMSEFSFKKLSHDLGDESDEDMIRNGTAAEAANFENICLSREGVTIEFQPYQVGPWSIGAQEVAIPLADLRPAGPSELVWPREEAADKQTGEGSRVD